MRTTLETYLLDTETIGFAGVPVLLQYAVDDGPVNVVHLWTTPACRVMALIEKFCAGRVVAHHLRFDWFHLSKIYNMLRLVPDKDKCLMDYSREQQIEWEFQSQYGPCLKPRAAVDTMIMAQKGQYQSYLMAAKSIYIRKIPTYIAQQVADELENRTELPWILFAGRGNKDAPMWRVAERKDDDGVIDKDFSDVVLNVQPSNSLKNLADFLCGHQPSATFDEIAIHETYSTIEEGFAPFAKLLLDSDKGGPLDEENLYYYSHKHEYGSKEWYEKAKPLWPAVLEQHINHWKNDTDAMAYAVDDIVMLKKLYEFFGSEHSDEDSMLACQVASVRLRGFAVDMDKMMELRQGSMDILANAETNVNSPKQVQAYLGEGLEEYELNYMADGCDKKRIKWMIGELTLKHEEECTTCAETGTNTITGKHCIVCGGKGKYGPGPRPVVRRLKHVNNIRKHKKRVELFDKFVIAQRAYPDFNVMGTKSGRMSGASGLNFQGVDSSKDVRSVFTLKDDDLVLSAGDYSSQELAIAATTMNDEGLMKDMESGKSLHGLFAAEAYQTTYEEIMRSYKEDDDERYGLAKGGVYAILYGGSVPTVATNMDISMEVAQQAYNGMVEKYPQMGSTRAAVTAAFSSLVQNAEGRMMIRPVQQPFVESIFGFRRYFNTEYHIQKLIFDLAMDMPDQWQKDQTVVFRSRTPETRNKPPEEAEFKPQRMSSALMSAFIGAAFSIQNKIIRAANNHAIQSAGRTLTVGLQYKVWELQPYGINEFALTIMSIHDELAVVSDLETTKQIRSSIEDKVAEQREVVPLTSIEWFTNSLSWAEKGGSFIIDENGKKKTRPGQVIGWSPTKEEVLA